MGLGLSIVKQIVDELGGRVFVLSAPDQGTTVEVFLPLVEPTIEIAEQVLSFEVRTGHGETIMVAEDDPNVRALIRDILMQESYAVLEAVDGLEALRIVEQHHGPIDLLLTDILMPNMNGCELAERVRALRPRIPIVFLSGYAENTAIHAAVQGQGRVFLQKPCAPPVLLNTIHELLASSS